MAATAKRTPFNPAGPFVARKNFSVFETNIDVHEVFDADVLFPRLHERRAELLFDAHYFDMAVPDQKRAKHLADYQSTSPLDRDGDGGKGGSLSRADKAALKQAGLTVGDWLKLPEPERTDTLAAALRAAPAASPPPGDGGQGGNSGGGDGPAAPETAATASPPDPAGVDGAKAPEGAEIAAYKHFGFGRWFAVDKDGKQVGAKVTKAEAEGLAAQQGVPVKGILE